jgi:hypothetical protein
MLYCYAKINRRITVVVIYLSSVNTPNFVQACDDTALGVRQLKGPWGVDSAYPKFPSPLDLVFVSERKSKFETMRKVAVVGEEFIKE